MKELMTTFRMADECNLVTQGVLKDVAKHFVLRKKEINSLDFSHGLELFGKYRHLPKEV